MASFQNALFLLAFLAALAPSIPAEAQDSEERLVQIQKTIQSGDIREARLKIEKALKDTPADPRLYNFLGVIEAQANNYPAAEANFRRAMAIAPRFPGPYVNLGRLYQERREQTTQSLEQALEVYGKLLQIAPGDLEATYQTSWILYRLKRFQESLRYLSLLPADAQHRTAALSLRCAGEAALDRVADAQACVQELAAAKDLTEADVLPFLPAWEEHREARLAMPLLERLAQDKAASPAALSELAKLYEENGRFVEAREILTREIPAAGPPPVELLSQLAKVAYRAGDLKGALGYLAHARDLAPQNAAIHFLFGLICVELKLPPEATQALRDAVRLDPGNPYYNYALGAVLLQQRNPDEAVRYFRNFRASRPEDPRGRLALGVALFDADQAGPAREELQPAADDPATRTGALLYLGRLALRDDDLEAAEALLRRSVESNAAVPDAQVELALVQIRRSEYDLAAKTLAHALELSPDNYRANLHLLLLYRRTKDTRAEEQARRVEQLQKASEEREQMLLRSLDVHPY